MVKRLSSNAAFAVKYGTSVLVSDGLSTFTVDEFQRGPI